VPVVSRLPIRQGDDDNHDLIYGIIAQHGEQSRVMEGNSPNPGGKDCSAHPIPVNPGPSL